MMKKRVRENPRHYPAWQRKKQQSPAWLCKERAGWICEGCKIAHRAIRLNRDGEPYMCYLHAAHAHHLDPQQPEPLLGQRLHCYCPTCHAAYDSYYRELVHHLAMHKILLANQFLSARFLLVN